MMPNFDKSSPELVARFNEVAPGDTLVSHKQMFGWPSLFINGNLFAGLHRQGIVVRLPPNELSEIMRKPGVIAFEPMPGRVMTGYALITDPLDWKRDELSECIAKSLAFARHLPIKAKKSAKKERR